MIGLILVCYRISSVRGGGNVDGAVTPRMQTLLIRLVSLSRCGFTRILSLAFRIDVPQRIHVVGTHAYRRRGYMRLDKLNRLRYGNADGYLASLC